MREMSTNGMSAKTRVQMVYALLIIQGLIWTVHSLTGPHVCKQNRTVPSTSMYSLDELLSDCENFGFTSYVCQKARTGGIHFSDLHLLKTVNVCCLGWLQSGDSCSTPCTSGSYGPNCALSCQCYNDGICDHVTGVCSCTAGWQGERCEERCSPNDYGPNCALPCQLVCENDAICHPSLGHCLCDFQWEATTCNSSCSHRNCDIESDSCSNGARFDPPSLCVCAAGWIGRYCTEPCPNNTYGRFCTDTCKCQNEGSCNWMDGSCTCRPGYTGLYCDELCSEGYYGQGCNLMCDCPQTSSCNNVDGACDVCPLGFMGLKCTQTCLDDSWGPSCRNTCNCPHGLVCDIYTGNCGDVVQLTTTSSPVSMSTVSQQYSVPTSPTFLAPILVGLVLVASVIVILSVVAIKKPCTKSAEKVKATPVYAATIMEKSKRDNGDGEYAEIPDIMCSEGNGEISRKSASYYQRPQHCNGQRRSPTSTNTPPIGGISNNAARFSDVSLDQAGYLELSNRQPPSFYQTMVVPRNI